MIILQANHWLFVIIFKHRYSIDINAFCRIADSRSLRTESSQALRLTSVSKLAMKKSESLANHLTFAIWTANAESVGTGRRQTIMKKTMSRTTTAIFIIVRKKVKILKSNKKVSILLNFIYVKRGWVGALQFFSIKSDYKQKWLEVFRSDYSKPMCR